MKFCFSLEKIIEHNLTEFAFAIKGKVLELGPYQGSKTKYLCRNKKLDIIGLDNDIKNEKYAQGYKFVLGDARNIPFQDEVFDAVVSFDVIEHIDQDEKMLGECFRVLRTGGFFCIGTPNRERLFNKIRKILGHQVSYPYKIDENTIHLREYTMDELKNLVLKSGFDIIKKEDMWLGLVGFGGFDKLPAFFKKYAHYLMIFAKK